MVGLFPRIYILAFFLLLMKVANGNFFRMTCSFQAYSDEAVAFDFCLTLNLDTDLRKR